MDNVTIRNDEQVSKIWFVTEIRKVTVESEFDLTAQGAMDIVFASPTRQTSGHIIKDEMTRRTEAVRIKI